MEPTVVYQEGSHMVRVYVRNGQTCVIRVLNQPGAGYKIAHAVRPDAYPTLQAANDIADTEANLLLP